VSKSADLGDERLAVAVGQPQVQQHEVGLVLADGPQALAAADRRLVVDDRDRRSPADSTVTEAAPDGMKMLGALLPARR
jgi:hypothetical protein